MVFTLTEVRYIAFCLQYKEVQCDERPPVIAFEKGENEERMRINVYYTTGTVTSYLNHPRLKKNQLQRREVTTLEELEQIFMNPRVHTGKGYHRKVRQDKPGQERYCVLCEAMKPATQFSGNQLKALAHERCCKECIELRTSMLTSDDVHMLKQCREEYGEPTETDLINTTAHSEEALGICAQDGPRDSLRALDHFKRALRMRCLVETLFIMNPDRAYKDRRIGKDRIVSEPQAPPLLP